MATVLFVTANPKPADQSFSLSVAGEFLEAYRKESPGDEIVSIDLYKTDIPYVDPDVLSGWGKLQQGEHFDRLTPGEQSKVARINQMADQFVAADKYIFVTPLWNLSIPPKMKAYIDTIVVVGKTFKYTDQGPVGLLKDKKAVHIQARGGFYSQGPAKDFEFGDRYIRAILTFLGVESIESVIVEGMAYMPDKAGEIKAKAVENAREAAKRFV
ncbi:MAG: FMN-dependent NADH-azoreductase [Actinobacteria bacterium]|nr:FMN-dependent NADH-azoreductase [Actinomycetota bacterium]